MEAGFWQFESLVAWRLRMMWNIDMNSRLLLSSRGFSAEGQSMWRHSLLLISASIFTSMYVSAQQAQSMFSTQDPSGRVAQALQAQDVARAIAEYRAMIATDPRNSSAWTGLGILLYGAGQATEASTALTTALQIDPQAPRAELFLAFSQADMQQCGKALPILGRYFATEPVGKLQRLTGLTILQCSSSSEKTDTALRTAAQMKRSYPGDPDVLYESAELYTRMWDETANELISAHPESYRVHQLAAEVNEAQGNMDQAIRQYRAALGQNAKLPQMHYRIGQLLLRKGDADADEKAMDEFRAELAINPQSATSALAMAEIERHQGKLTEAMTQYNEALKLEPGLPEARVGLAQTLLAEHQVDASQSQLRALISEYPENAQAHYAMMLAYREQGDLPGANREMESFRRLQQGSADQFQKKLNALLTGTTSGIDAAKVGTHPNP
jgi:predicted Zn-dependent protease